MRSDPRRPLLLACCAAALLCGCGQKGPLYLPDQTGSVVTRPGTTPASPETTPAPAPSPAAAPATPPQATTDEKSPKEENDEPKS